MTERLPRGFQVVLDPTTLRLSADRLLVGGSPITAMCLATAAASRLGRDRVTVSDAISAELAERLIATNLAHPDVTAAATVDAPDLTVVVPVRDRPGQLERCLAALTPLDVIVVDDASHEPQVIAAVAQRHGARLARFATNRGPASARNAGLALVRTPVVAFVDSDVEVTAAALIELTRHLTDPAVTLVGPRIVGRIRSPRPRWFEHYDAAASSLTLGQRPSTVRPGAAVAWLPSACLVGRTEMLGQGFDETMRVGEDVDLVWRLTDAGHRVRYAPETVAHHDVRPSMKGWLGRKFVYGTGGAALAQRHGSYTAPAVLSPTMALAGAALLLRRRWSLPLVAVALGVATRSVRRSLPKSVDSGTRARVAAGLAVRGVGWAARQESALLVRHWWPLTLLGIRSRSMRRAVVTALVIDTWVAVDERTDSGLPLTALLAGRRLDDLAYGAGLWAGALRSLSVATLLPRRPGATPPLARPADSPASRQPQYRGPGALSPVGTPRTTPGRPRQNRP